MGRAAKAASPLREGAITNEPAATLPSQGTSSELVPGAMNGPSARRAQELKSLLHGQVHHLSELCSSGLASERAKL